VEEERREGDAGAGARRCGWSVADAGAGGRGRGGRVRLG
jgi:hypothetical protein